MRVKLIKLKIHKINNEWLGGFIDSEGCFYLNNNKTLAFSISQHKKDIALLIAINNKFLDNKAFKYKNKDCNILRIQNKNILLNYITPINT